MKLYANHYSTAVLAISILLLIACKDKAPSSTPNDETAQEPVATEMPGCKSLPSTFSSYDEAKETIQKSEFKLTDQLAEANSAWIASAAFYSCDEQTGYFILVTDDQEYIHSGIPVTMWEEFKTATSHGTFYNANIRDRYLLPLIQQE
jgi:hypothetical protein